MQSRILTEPDLSLNSWSKVLHHIYELARDIPWLREECGLVIVEAIDSLNGQSKLRDFAQQVIERLVSFNLANTPEGVAIWLTVKAQFEDVLPSDVWSSQDPLAKNERKRLAKVLKEDFRGSSQGGEGEGIKSAAANPNPTFAWDLVLSEILRRDETNNERKEKPEFPQFWLDTVDSKSCNRKYTFAYSPLQITSLRHLLRTSANHGVSSSSPTSSGLSLKKHSLCSSVAT